MTMSLKRLLSIISTVFPNVFILAAGNYLSYIHLNYSEQAISLMLIHLLASNWMGLQDFLLLEGAEKKRVMNRLLIDPACILLVSLLLQSLQKYNNQNLLILPITSICSYLLYFLAGISRALEKYLLSAALSVILSMMITFAWFEKDVIIMAGVLAVEVMSLVFLMSIFNEPNSLMEKVGAAQRGKQSLVVYFSAFMGSILFGEIDRFILSYAKSSNIGFYYSTINFLIAVPLLFYASSIAYMVNVFKTHGVVTGVRILYMALVISLFVGMIYTFTYDSGSYASISSGIMIMAIFIKLLVAATMLPYIVALYSIGDYKKIIIYNYAVGIAQLVISLFLFFSFSPLIVISFGRLLSALVIGVFILYFRKYLLSNGIAFKLKKAF